VKIRFIYPRFNRHADDHPELREFVPCNEYLGSPSLGISAIAAATPPDWEVEFCDDRVFDGAAETDADIVALSFFTPAAKRGIELAQLFRDRGHTVVAGGIFPTMMAQELDGVAHAVVVGEGERIWPRLLDDFKAGRLAPRYAETPADDTGELPPPRLELYFDAEHPDFRPDDYPLQVSRGCPLACHACVLPTSMGRKLRPIPMATIIDQLDRLEAAGKHACLTEDTSWLPGGARRTLEALFDHLIERGSKALVSYIGTSFPMIRAASPHLLEKAKAAGVDMFYLVTGFDPISMRAFTGKDDKALRRAEEAVARAWELGIEPYTSFLLGGDQDDEGTVDRVLEFCERTRILKAEFAISTPYPGTPEWHRLNEDGRILTRDWSRYNDANVVFRPAQMTPEALQEGYLRLWREFYTDRDHLRDLPYYERTIQF
jgi:radical SAM superfamily enzyme YgiQ (UPF0313 family)